MNQNHKIPFSNSYKTLSAQILRSFENFVDKSLSMLGFRLLKLLKKKKKETTNDEGKSGSDQKA